MTEVMDIVFYFLLDLRRDTVNFGNFRPGSDVKIRVEYERSSDSGKGITGLRHRRRPVGTRGDPSCHRTGGVDTRRGSWERSRTVSPSHFQTTDLLVDLPVSTFSSFRVPDLLRI